MNQGFKVEWIPVNTEGIISLEAVEKLLRADTVLVSVMHVNNETGAIQPIEGLSNIVRGNSRALIHMDAVQSFGKMPVNFRIFDVDAITISSHKIHGLKGIGITCVKKIHRNRTNSIRWRTGVRNSQWYNSCSIGCSYSKSNENGCRDIEEHVENLQRLSNDLVRLFADFSVC